MKAFLLFSFLLAFFASSVFAWEKEDHEIFDLVSALQASEGKGTTFYSWLDVPPTATTPEIAKAYRKKSMLLHPDKNPNDKTIHERFARLGVISTILRNKESRDRYDFFYKNGVPKWRGTGYYYSRFRPGLGSVLVFLVVVSSGFHYIIQHINYRADLGRINRFVKEAQQAAWGPKLVPIDGQRKVKVNINEGRAVDMVVDANNVYLLDDSGEKHILDASTASRPDVTTTWFLALVKSLYYRVLDRVSPPPEYTSTEGEDDSSSEAPGSGTVTPSEKRVAGAPGGKRKRAGKR